LDEADGEALLVVGLADGVAELESAGAADGATPGSDSIVTCGTGACTGAGATGAG
jgi:hypothetical protein